MGKCGPAQAGFFFMGKRKPGFSFAEK